MKKITHLCSECNACIQICKHKAIVLIENEEGFSYPFIDENKCINCKLCEKVCPMENATNIIHNTSQIFAAQAKNKTILKRSSSGAIFPLIAEFVLEKKGIVYGATWDENLQLVHQGIKSIHDLKQLTGSKYVHSQINNIYIEIKNHLKQGKLVYFTGTPCQVAGLKLFLQHEYRNLLTSDLICHGTPSQKIFNLFISHIEDESDKKVVNYNFRDKNVFGWNCNSSSLILNNHTNRRPTKIIYNKNMRAYFKAFISGNITRYDCYQCPYARKERVGDITLGDYWDIEKQHSNFPNLKQGVSLILINSEQGEFIWKHINKKCHYIKSSLDNVLQTCNTQLKYPTPCPKTRLNAYSKAFSDFITFRDSYLDPDDRKNFYKTYSKRILKKNIITNLILKTIGK